MSSAVVNTCELATDTVLQVRNLSVEFFGERFPVKAVDNISFELKRGEILGIVGESGSGKSVTSLAVMGLIPSPGKISNGEIWFRPARTNNRGGENAHPVNLMTVGEQKRRNYRGGEIAMIFQEPMSALNPVYTIGFQITEAIRLHQNVTPQQAKNQAIELLREVKLLPSDDELERQFIEDNKEQKSKSGLLTQQRNNYLRQYKESLLNRYPHELSGGQLQRVTIAMAISCNPTILIADEPTTALDVTVQKEILNLLRELCKTHRDMSMIFISHDLGVINSIADVVAVMYKGEIVEQDKKSKILYEPQSPYTKGLLACRPRLQSPLEILPVVEDFMVVAKDTATGKVLSITEKEPPEFKQIAVEEQQQRLARLEAQETILSVENLLVQFPIRGVFGQAKKFVKAVDNISFNVKRGETLGLVGESGCGKSTLARTILRLIPASAGEIQFQNQLISHLSIGDKKLRSLRKEMQIVFQNPYNSLNPRMTIGQAIMEPTVIHHLAKTSQERKNKAKSLLERVGLDPNWFDRYPHQLSGGQRQRVCIARALAVAPQFIICDESVSALDVSVQAGVLNLLKALQKELNLTYIFISHDLSVVRFMSDRIMVMNKGRQEEIGSAQKIIDAPEKDYTKKLIASIPQF